MKSSGTIAEYRWPSMEPLTNGTITRNLTAINLPSIGGYDSWFILGSIAIPVGIIIWKGTWNFKKARKF